MKRTNSAIIAFLLTLAYAASMALAQATAEPKPINLWPGTAPGEKGDIGPEHDTTKNDPPGKRVIRLGFVSVPTLTVFRATENANGAAVIVAREIGRRGLAAQVTINALIINEKLAVDVLWELVCSVCHDG